MNQQEAASDVQESTRNGSLLSGAAVRPLLLVLSAALALLMAWQPLARIMRAADRSDYYSHILLVPFVTAYFLFQYRNAILKKCTWAVLPGSLVMAGALGLYVLAGLFQEDLGAVDFASLTTLSSAAFFAGGFILLFGGSAFRAAEFPLFFLLFAVPVPRIPFDWLINGLQVASAELTEWLFQLTGTDYIRKGFVFQLPNIAIEVARECSGIRSSIAAVITGVLAAHLFLHTGWRKVVLVAAMLPVTIFKNGLRIVTLSLLSIYVDPKFITDSWLHHSGGFVFYLLVPLMLVILVWGLRKGEKRP